MLSLPLVTEEYSCNQYWYPNIVVILDIGVGVRVTSNKKLSWIGLEKLA